MKSNKKYTAIEKLSFLDESAIKRFWSYVNIGSKDECWDWKGGKTHEGYGRLSFHDFSILSHRISILLSGRGNGDGMVAMHSCDRKICCNPNHLSWGTISQNTLDAFKRGLIKPKRGEKAPMAKLSDIKIQEIIEIWKSQTMTQVKIAEKYGIKDAYVSEIVNNKKRKHGNEYDEQHEFGMRNKYKKEEIAKILELAKNGLSQTEIARSFNMAQSTVSRYVNNRRRVKTLNNIKCQ